MKPPLLAKARQKWPGVQREHQHSRLMSYRLSVSSSNCLHVLCAAVANILTLPENDEVMVVGTVYKDMKLKPSILDEYVKVQFLRHTSYRSHKLVCSLPR